MDEDTLTAYHEAGHAVIGYALGGRIESIGMYAEADEWLPERFGDCRVNWGRVRADCDWQAQREILTILAGPVAEMIYRGEDMHPALFPPWQHDWQWAWTRSARLFREPNKRKGFLEATIASLKQHLNHDLCWAAIAAVSDELLAHEYLDEDQLEDTLAFWIRNRS